MKLQSLISVLTNQEKNLKKLLEIINQKKDALVGSNYELLNKLVNKEEQSLLDIQLTEEERLKITKDLFEQYEITSDRYKLEILLNSLVNKVDSRITQEIGDSEKRIKNTIKEITRVNHLNMVLIQQSRSLISQTIEAVLNTNTKSILDRKG